MQSPKSRQFKYFNMDKGTSNTQDAKVFYLSLHAYFMRNDIDVFVSCPSPRVF